MTMIYTTRKTLLEAIKDGDEVSWHEFYDTYRPLIILHGKDYKLSVEENEELVQMILLEIFHKCKSFHYDRGLGRLRDYLRKIIGRKAVDILRRRKNNLVSVDVLNDQLAEESYWSRSGKANGRCMYCHRPSTFYGRNWNRLLFRHLSCTLLMRNR